MKQGMFAEVHTKGELMIRRFLLLAVALLIAVPPAYAGMIQTQDPERERVKALLERADVRAGLEQHGVRPQDAAARVDAMTPAEVRELAGRIDKLAAGGAVSNQELLLIIILVLVLIIAL